MDFGTLLQTARENEQIGKNSARYYSTKFAPPKKEEKKAKALSVNIQKFLARKEAEEKKKSIEANKKRDELLALRSKDKKATRRVNVMLKRTKSANQSVIEDAVDKDNTAVTLAGPSQPDEDDYGYVSQEAAAFYNKMMEKYNKMPDDPKFPTSKKKASNNLSSTKDRVKAALEREKEEAMMPHRRKRKHKEEEDCSQINETYDSDDQDTTEPPPKVIQKTGGPPPMNFSDLLKLAAQKQHEPIMIEVKPKEEEGPLLTKKQKREIEKERQRKEAKLQNSKMQQDRPSSQQIENRISSKPTSLQQNQDKLKKVTIHAETENQGSRPNNYKNNGKIPKVGSQNNHSSYNNHTIKAKLPPTTSQNTKPRDGSLNTSKAHNEDTYVPRPRNVDPSPLKTSKTPLKYESSSNKTDPSKRRPLDDVPRKNNSGNLIPSKKTYDGNRKVESSNSIEKKNPTPKTISASSFSSSSSTAKLINKNITNTNSMKKDLKFNGSSKDMNKSKPVTASSMKPRDLPSANIQPKRFPPDDMKPKQFPPRDLKPKQFPPADLKPKQFPPPDVRQREFPPKDVKRKPPMANKRRIMYDDEDYDSEMDDFIDDGPEETEDYSGYIKDIFGYDRSKYRGMDDDDVDNMESTFAQQMREDVRSTKLGIMEDLEDIKREKEEKKRKAMLKKRKL